MKCTITATEKRKPFDRHYLFCVGSGHAPLALRTDYVKQLKQVHEELGIERVRFHGIFDEDMKVVLSLKSYLPMPGTEKFRDISFNQIGLAYDNILATGMKPLVELSFMPALFARSKKQLGFSYKARISPPGDYKEWDAFIRKFIRFLLDRYGKAEVEQWYFEVWNEPNIGTFFDGSRKDYFELYAHTARAIKSVDKNLRVGGPATATNSWVKELVEYCQANKVPIDFCSTHQYMGEPLGHDAGSMKGIIKSVLGGMKEIKKHPGGSINEGVRMMFEDSSETRDFSKTLFADNVKAVKKQAGKLPLFYTEWNAASCCGAPHNDTRKLAANAVKNILDVEGHLEGSSIWCFSDIFEESFMFPQEFSGNFGLLTIHGIKKPVYHAFELLRQVGDVRIAVTEEGGEIGIGAFENEEGMQLLLYRLDLKCRKLPAETARIEIECDRPVRVTVQKIDEDHCNPLKLWQKMGSPMDMKPADAKKIDEATALVEEEQPFGCRDGKLYIDTALGVNDVQLIKIYKESAR